MLKKIIPLSFLAVLLCTGWIFKTDVKNIYHNATTFSFCSKPVEYKIGDIDPKFGISKNKLNESAQQAANVWNTAYGKTLFTYNSQAALEIDLVYDERQSLTQEIGQINSSVEQDSTELTQKISQHQQEYETLKNQIDKLTQEISYWNNKGGAPVDKYEDLIKQQQNLQNQIDEFNLSSNSLNEEAENLNTRIGDLNSTIQTFNSVLEVKPEAGLYIPTENKIEIFSFSNSEALTSTIAHEFGHALGLSHISTPEALMNPIASTNSHFTSEDLNALNYYCREQNKIDYFMEQAKIFINTFYAEITKNPKL